MENNQPKITMEELKERIRKYMEELRAKLKVQPVDEKEEAAVQDIKEEN